MEVMVYRLSSAQKVYSGSISVGLMVLSVFVATDTSMRGKDFPAYFLPVAILIFGIGIGLWMLRAAFSFKVVIDDKSVSITKNFKTKELQFSEIEGCRSGARNISLEPKDKTIPAIIIPSKIEKYEQIQSWAKKHFNDLDVIENELEQAGILQNEQLGNTKEERELQLVNAKRIALFFNLAGVVIAVWAYLSTEPFALLWILCILFPLLTLAVLRFYNGLIRTDFSKASAYPGIPALFFVQLVLLYRAATDYDIVDYTNLLMPTFVLGALLTVLQAYKRDEFSFATKEGKTAFAIAFVTWLAFSYGSIVFYNCFCDKARYTTCHAQISNTYTYSGKSGKSYYIRLTAWQYGKENESFTIKEDLFDRVRTGQTLNIYVHCGNLNSTWYHISDIDEPAGH